MKLSCEIVQDLLPLYEDEVCSGESRAAVEEHLRECSSCRRQIRCVQSLREQEPSVHPAQEQQAAVRSFRKIRRRWAASLVAVLLALPVLLLSVNQVRGVGVCYTNIDDILTARKFMQALEMQAFEKAFDMVDFECTYEEIQEARKTEADDESERIAGDVYYGEILDLTAEEFASLMRERHCRKLAEYGNAGFTFESSGYKQSVYNRNYYDKEKLHWSITYGAAVSYQGKTYPIFLEMGVTDGEIVSMLMFMDWNQEFPGANALHWILSGHYISDDYGLYTGVPAF